MSSVYSGYYEVNKLETSIMVFIDEWAHKEKTPISQRQVLEHMKSEGIPDPTTIAALHSLLHKKFIRRAIMTSNKTFYVMLRRV